jgi:homoserine kinase type II
VDESIQGVLARYGTSVRNAEVVPLGSAGGLSGAQLWRVLTPSRKLVLRRWPREHPSLQHLQWIHGILEQVHRRGIRYVPVPLPTTAGATSLIHAGHLWELAPWMSGVADFHRRPTSERLAAALAALARFHLASQDELRSHDVAPSIVERHGRLLTLQEGGLRRLEESLQSAASPLAPLAARFLRLAAHRIPATLNGLMPLVDLRFSVQACIRDIWHDHVLFSGDDVTGLVDFGAMRIDTPATDVARLLGSLAGNDANFWTAGLAAYDRVRRLDDIERRAVVALDQAGTILGGCNWVRWALVEQRDFGSPAVVESRLGTLLARLLPEAPRKPQGTQTDTIDQTADS